MIPRLVSHILEFSRIDTNLIYCIFELENPCGVGSNRPRQSSYPLNFPLQAVIGKCLTFGTRNLAVLQTHWIMFVFYAPSMYISYWPMCFYHFKHPTNDIEINDPSSFSDSCVANCHCLQIQAAINNWRCAPPPSFRSRQKPQGRPTQFQGFRWTLSTSIPWCGTLTSLGDGWCWVFGGIPFPIPSMYGIFAYIWLIFTGNVYR